MNDLGSETINELEIIDNQEDLENESENGIKKL